MADWEFPTAVAEKILEALPHRSLLSILKAEGMPSYRAVMRRLRNDEQFRADYAQAMEDRGDHDAERVAALARTDRDILRKVETGELNPKQARVMLQASKEAADKAKWSAGVRRAKVYGSKLDLNHSGSIVTTPAELTEEQILARLKELRGQ